MTEHATPGLPQLPDVHAGEPSPRAGNPAASENRLRNNLSELKKSAIRLLWVGYIVSFISVVSFLMLVGWAGMSSPYMRPHAGHFAVYFAVAALVSSTLGFVFLWFWENLRRLGSIQYDWVSDEVEWRFGTGIGAIRKEGGDAETARSRPYAMATGCANKDGELCAGDCEFIALRLLLRAFLHAAELPFCSRGNSRLVYAVYFASCILIVLLGSVLYNPTI